MQVFFRYLIVALCFSGQVWADGAGQAARDGAATVDMAGSAQSVQTLAQQTRQQAALQATLEKIQADQAKVTVTALEARAARDSAVAASL